ncbi:integrin alpha-X-like isoform X1 [Podarcis raffonei]|uniref:integrin alpha-X-like isoform X1 n=2 Tax=Podarcis raffonei TaxID=65483 RepID=UPI0023298B08|nr:integrin alpha-X-like isoform X1 [Podarcis raffonei]
MEPAIETKWILKAAFFLCLGWCSAVSSDFNIIDTETPVFFQGDKAPQFGYRVVQTRADDGTSWLVVSAPMSGNRTGSLFRCSYDTEKCQPVVLHHNNTSGISLGLSLAADKSDSKIIACGPTWERRCGDFDYLNGVCYIMSNFNQPAKEIHPAFQECTVGVDAVILFDDSGSISDGSFLTVKNFTLQLMASVSEADVQFAMVQFSTEVNLVFDFNYYNAFKSKVKEIVDAIQQTKGNTHTPTAIRYVVDKVFLPKLGMRPHSKKLLIVLTDGVSNDRKTTFEVAIQAADKKGIIRYAIGVGKQTRTDELNTIASSPNNVFEVDSFDALSSIQNQLKDKIFAIEGTSGISAGNSFQKELSQGGFSALLTPEHVVTGAVGAHTWSGGLEEQSLGDPPQIQFLNISFNVSYLGYSVAVAQHGQKQFYIAGAPRYQHVGAVAVFESRSKRLVVFSEGDQLGSYYGAEVCSVDLDEDNNTDLVLIGAPHYYSKNQGGLVDVRSMNDQGHLVSLQTLRGDPGSSFGRFGAALCALGDISGDGFADVAIGAPMEDEDCGAIYIFLGEAGGLKKHHGQRIAAKSLSLVLHYFGQSIQGRMDLSEDGLTDLAVGALGSAVLLRSRPVFTINSSLTFSHRWIPLDDPKCGSGNVSGIAPRGKTSLCFNLKLISTKWTHGALQAAISFTLRSDAKQSPSRLTLENEASTFSDTILVGTKRVCVEKILHAPLCLDDSFSPLVLRADVTAKGEPEASARNLRPVLDPATNLSTEIKVPFKQDCGLDKICVADLRISFNFSGSNGLKLSPNFILNLTLKLENVGEAAYNPHLSFYYSSVLSFRGHSVLQSNWRLSPACQMHGPQGNASVRHSSCRFNPPVLKGGTQAVLQISLQSSKGDSWNDTFAYFDIQAHSENENDTLSDNKATGRLPVLHRVNVIVKGLASTAYLNFSTKMPEKKTLIHAFEVRNLDSTATPVNVTFELPFNTEVGFSWNVTPSHRDVINPSSCPIMPLLRTRHKTEDLKGPITRGCLGATVCSTFQCLISNLSRGQWVKFKFSWNFSIDDIASKLTAQKLHLRSEASAVVDETRFFQPEEFQFSQISTEVELISPFNPIPIIVGSTIGGILLLAIIVAVLFKFGFFKRNRVSLADEIASEPAGPGEQTPQATN